MSLIRVSHEAIANAPRRDANHLIKRVKRHDLNSCSSWVKSSRRVRRIIRHQKMALLRKLVKAHFIKLSDAKLW